MKLNASTLNSMLRLELRSAPTLRWRLNTFVTRTSNCTRPGQRAIRRARHKGVQPPAQGRGRTKFETEHGIECGRIQLHQSHERQQHRRSGEFPALRSSRCGGPRENDPTFSEIQFLNSQGSAFQRNLDMLQASAFSTRMTTPRR